MSKVAVVYWSGTGNTEMMAQAVAEGVESTSASASLFRAVDFNEKVLTDFDAVAFGCPSMGAEELEDYEFLPMFDAVKDKVGTKPVALFGSYDWGNGEWMEAWEKEVTSLGLNVVTNGLIVHLMPDEEGLEKSKSLGMTLANAI